MATAYLQRTLTSGNQKTFTISFWVKRSALGTGTMISYAQTPGNTSHARGYMNFATDSLHFAFNPTGSSWWSYNVSNRLFRDTSAWYHLVARVDTTDASASNRLKIYVNGEQQTLNSTIGTQNLDTGWNNNSYTLRVGEYAGDGGENFDGQFAHFHYIDGTAYDASTFGETDSTTGIWKPKTAPSVTYGTNGFFLKFENSSAMGTDSGGSNNLTVSGTVTKLIDTPSNVFATINPLYNVTTFNGSKLSNNNTTAACSTNYKGVILSTLGASTGKYYFEAKITNADDFGVGITDDAISLNTWSPSSGNYVFYLTDGSIRRPSGSTSSGTTYTTNDIIGVAWNATDSEVTFYKNGSAIASAYSVEGTQGTMMFAIADVGTSSDNTVHCNFGNGYFGTTAVSSAENPDDGIGIFEYDVPAGYRALCTKSINAQEYS
jgi:hypothetical protein